MFARFFTRLRQPKPVGPDHFELAKNIRASSKKMQDYLLTAISDLGFKRPVVAESLKYAAKLTFSDRNWDKEMAGLDIRNNLASQYVYFYLLAIQQLNEVIKRTHISPMSADRVPLFLHELDNVHGFVNKISANEAARNRKGNKQESNLSAGLNIFKREIKLLRQESAIKMYENYITQRKIKHKNENSLLRFLREKFSEFNAEKKMGAATEMINFLKNPRKQHLSDAAINALVNGKLGLLTQQYANKKLWGEIERRYDSETNSYQVKGLEIVSPRRRYG